MNRKTVPVYRGGKLVGQVSQSATSIGAAKLAGTEHAQFTRAGYGYVWIAFDRFNDADCQWRPEDHQA